MTAKLKAPAPKDDLPQTWLLCGEDPRFIEEHSRRWIERWCGEGGAVSLPAPGLPPPVFHTEVNSLPFLKERQVVRLSHLEDGGVDLLEAVASYAKNPCPSTALLLEYIGSPPKGEGKRAARGGAAALETIFASVPVLTCRPTSVRSYVEKRLRDAGIAPSPGTVEAVEEWSGKDFAKVASAMDLLLLYRAGEKTLKEGDVAALLGAGGSPPRWDLQDAFVSREPGRFRSLLAEVERDPEVERDASGTALAFVGMLAKQVRALLIARGLNDAGEGREAVTRALGGDPLRLHSFVAGKILSALPRWNEAKIRQAIEALYRLDLALKGAAEPGPAWTLVEKYIAKVL